MKVCIVAGARPNFVKIAPLTRAIDAAEKSGKNISYTLVYTGSKDDPTIEPSLFADLDLRRPDAFLGVDCENLNELTGRVMSEFDKYLTEHNVDVVIVVDDLASTMAAAIVTKKRGIRLAHLVAGTRSFDINMPKEINRLVIDGLSDLLFTAGVGSTSAASREGDGLSKVYMVGNILMDTLRHNHMRLVRPKVFDTLGLEPKKYIVFTVNRKALLADETAMVEKITAACNAAGNVRVVAVLRDAARRVLSSAACRCSNLSITEPMTYLEFGYLTANAEGIITDSGNVAEEATFNGVPCITLNDYTEHIETVKCGSNVLVGSDTAKLTHAVHDMVKGQWKKCSLPDRWDGRTAERIVQTLLESK